MAKEKIKFATPKGTRDYLPEDMRVRRHVLNVLRGTFESFGYGELDTPAFEPFEMLAAKSGEDVEKQIYAFEDKGGRKLGLRFEFTASLARVIANNPNLRMPFRRYQIGKVWRYEAPQAGRYREFYHADVDIVGSESMACEAELLAIFNAVCETLELGDYSVVINHRKILIADLERLGIQPEKHFDVLRSLDKFHKIGPDGVRAELAGRGFSKETSATIADEFFDETLLTEHKWPWENESRAKQLKENEAGRIGIGQLEEIYRLAVAAGVQKERIHYDPTLVRGLDYYTGPIFEFQTMEETGVGSFGGGGRYDNLVAALGGPPKPATGFAFGVDRLIHVYTARHREKAAIPPADVYIIPENAEAVGPALKLASLIRQKGRERRKDVDVLVALEPKKAKKEFQFAAREGFPRVIFVTNKEAAEDKAQLRKMKAVGESVSETLPSSTIAEIILEDDAGE